MKTKLCAPIWVIYYLVGSTAVAEVAIVMNAIRHW